MANKIRAFGVNAVLVFIKPVLRGRLVAMGASLLSRCRLQRP